MACKLFVYELRGCLSVRGEHDSTTALGISLSQMVTSKGYKHGAGRKQGGSGRERAGDMGEGKKKKKLERERQSRQK